MAGFGFGIGGFTQGVDNGIKEGTSLANTFNQIQSRKDDLGLRQKADARAQTQFDEQQQTYQDTQNERDLGQQALSDYNGKVAGGDLPPNHFGDYFAKNYAPQIVAMKMARNDVTGATQFDQWSKDQQKQSLANNLGTMVAQTHQAVQTGDFQPVNDTIKNIWNNLPPEISGGAQFQRLDVAKGQDGTPQGITAVYLGPDKKIVKQQYNSLPEFVQHVEDLSHPQDMFERERDAGLLGQLATAGGQTGAAQGAQQGSADNSVDFSSAPLASTPPASLGNSASPGTPAPQAKWAPPAPVPRAPAPAPSPVPAAPPRPVAAASPGAPVAAASGAPVAADTDTASAQPAPSSVQPLGADTASPAQAATQNQPPPSGEMGEVFARPAPPNPAAAPIVPTGLGSPAAAPDSIDLGQINSARKASGQPPLTIDQAAQLMKPDASKSSVSAPSGGPQPAAPAVPAVPAAPPAAVQPPPNAEVAQPQPQPQPQPNITVVPTRPVSPDAGQTAPSNAAPPAGLTPEVADAVVRGLHNPDKAIQDMAKQVLQKYLPQKYEMRALSSGDVVAVNPMNPADVHTIYRAGKGDGDDNVKLAAQAIQNGDQPPVLTGLYRDGIAVKAQLEKNGFNVANAQVEWTRAQKQIAALNGPQMTRFVGLASSVTNTIDEVNDLSSKMALGGIPALNRAELAAYVQADGNSENGQLATRYLTAVNTLKEEFANLAQGGYAPTESAWGLANQQINGNFGVKQLGASLNEVQRLVKYRVQAVPGLSTEGPGTPNRYFGTTAPSQAAPAATAPAATNGAPTQATKQAAPSPGHYSFNPASGKLELVQ